jgi:pyruvate formate lyase activating enzyme
VIQGSIFDIQRYSIHDGPGIRTVVFFKGCPLRCAWCSNPEGQHAAPVIEFFAARCQRCGRCVEVCSPAAVNRDLECAPAAKLDRMACTLCGQCIDACGHEALKMSGRTVTVADVLTAVKKDAAFYRRSGGGVTLSGGEPLAQAAFAEEILRRCRDANIHTAMETCGYAAADVFQRVVAAVDLVLFDLKHMDPAAHVRQTGVSNRPVLENLAQLSRWATPVIARIPLIPGWNDGSENLSAVASRLVELGIRDVHLMPFHQLGKDKYRRLGMQYDLADVASLLGAGNGTSALSTAQAVLESAGLAVQIGG